MNTYEWTNVTTTIDDRFRFVVPRVAMSRRRKRQVRSAAKVLLNRNYSDNTNNANNADDADDVNDADSIDWKTEYFGSGEANNAATLDMMKKMREASGQHGLDSLYEDDKNSDSLTADTPVHVTWEWSKGQTRLVNWETEPYFFSKCFPFTFMPATINIDGVLVQDVPSDYNCKVARNSPISFAEYAKHLTKIHPRFMAHPILKFVLLNIKNRKSLFSQLNFMVSVSVCVSCHCWADSIEKTLLTLLFSFFVLSLML